MGYCNTCNEWCGFSTSYCEKVECELVRKLIGLYGIEKIGKSLELIFIRNDKAIKNRTEHLEEKKKTSP
tara:strand:+ start:124 stop:330 length:207 start_codon:yes stop_codon:yes gene_type:complete